MTEPPSGVKRERGRSTPKDVKAALSASGVCPALCGRHWARRATTTCKRPLPGGAADQPRTEGQGIADLTKRDLLPISDTPRTDIEPPWNIESWHSIIATPAIALRSTSTKWPSLSMARYRRMRLTLLASVDSVQHALPCPQSKNQRRRVIDKFLLPNC